MALYNLGLAEQARRCKTTAYRFFQLAFSHYNKEDGDGTLFDDLRLQLGILAGDLEKHQEALQYLEIWWENNKNSPRAGRVLYHLGKARYGVGESRQAMVDLQRALQFNEFDDRAMNLLGMLYLKENEGNEIALALCRKSVELEPNNTFYRCNLAEVQLQCGMPLAAREHLYRCLRNKHTRPKAQLLLGRSYAQEGQERRANTWFEKIIKQRSMSTELSQEVTMEIQKAGGG
jgi:tetratricopeptide (TPR) repeat protein